LVYKIQRIKMQGERVKFVSTLIVRSFHNTLNFKYVFPRFTKRTPSFLLCLYSKMFRQDFGAHPASYSIGAGIFPRCKAAGA